MANNAKRISELGVPTTLTSNDRVVVLTGPGTPIANVQSILLPNLGTALASNNFPIANATSTGIIVIGDSLTIDANTGVTSVAISSTGIPDTSVYTGFPGQIKVSTTHLYVCVARNIWKRVPLDAAF